MNTSEVIKILEENKITNVVKKNKLLPLKNHYIPSVTEKPTHSEEMQNKLEPIPFPCPMHEDYDDNKKDNI